MKANDEFICLDIWKYQSIDMTWPPEYDIAFLRWKYCQWLNKGKILQKTWFFSRVHASVYITLDNTKNNTFCANNAFPWTAHSFKIQAIKSGFFVLDWKSTHPFELYTLNLK